VASGKSVDWFRNKKGIHFAKPALSIMPKDYVLDSHAQLKKTGKEGEINRNLGN